MSKIRLLGGLLVLGSWLGANAAPHVPSSDDQVLERLPSFMARAGGTGLQALQRSLAVNPRDAALALQLVDQYMALVAAEGDPRFVGYAQAALAPWWQEANPPADVRVARAVLLQFNHNFDRALADLTAVVEQHGDHAQAWAWIAAIAMVQADYPRARQACERAAAHTSELNAQACLAQADGATGQARAAAARMEQALREHADEPAEARLWALTRLAELRERLGETAAAEATFRQALALGIEDGYLQAAFADFLLDRGRGAEVIRLLDGKQRSDLLLLRLALAAKATAHPQLATWRGALAARFDAARLRGDTAHQKEEARFALEVLGDAARALPLAVANYQVQREAADARLLLEAALAARESAAAAPVLDWLKRTRFESRILETLAARLATQR